MLPSYLPRAFKFDYVKLERSFIAPLVEGHGDSDLIAGLVTLAKGLGGAEVIAEGISTSTLASVCRSLGCDCGQGYYFSPPAPGGRSRNADRGAGQCARRLIARNRCLVQNGRLEHEGRLALPRTRR
jgi:EAL domain-containing protein (putative c-di-GMP-specific phosphodiesterase class I)